VAAERSEGDCSASQAKGARAVGSRGRRSRPRLPTAERSESAPEAPASRAAQSERVSRSAGDAARVAEHRRISRACPPKTASVSPVGRFSGRLATITRAVGGGPERPVSKRRSEEEPTREGAFPPYYCCAGRKLTKPGEERGLARFLRPCPEATESERKGDGPVEGCLPERSGGSQPGPSPRALSRRRDAPKGQGRRARSVTGRGAGTGEAELGRREVADRRSGGGVARSVTAMLARFLPHFQKNRGEELLLLGRHLNVLADRCVRVLFPIAVFYEFA